MRQNVRSFVFFILLIVGSATAAMGMDHCGVISADETWYAADNPHVLTCHVYVEGGSEAAPATLTIEPGVEIYANTNIWLYVGSRNWGRLVAVGDAENEILFTSNQNPRQPGDWGGIAFYDRSDSTVEGWTSQMSRCTVEYGGASANYGSIYIDTADISIDSCTIQMSADLGLRIITAFPEITDSTINNNANYGIDFNDGAGAGVYSGNTLSGNQAYPIRIWAEYVRTLGNGNTYTGNMPNKIRVEGDTVQTTGTWIPQGNIPYYIANHIYIQNSVDPPVLTIEKGVTLRFEINKAIYVGYNYPGALTAVGTADKKITFTSDVEPGFHGDWQGIHLYPQSQSLSDNNMLEHCVIEYAGRSYGSIYANNTSVRIRNTTISDSFKHGIYFSDVAHPRDFTGNLIKGAYQNPIYIYGDYVWALGSDNTYIDNEDNEIYVVSDNVETTCTWPDPGIPYRISGHLYFRKNGGAPIVTLTPGSVFKIDPNVRIYVGYTYQGGLVAKGDPCNPILFTSRRTETERDQILTSDSPGGYSVPGDWDGIFFYSQTLPESEISNCIIEYAGSSGSGSIYIANTNVAVDRNLIRHSVSHGLYLTNASSPVSKNLIMENMGDGIHCTGPGTSPQLTHNHILNNNNGVVAGNSAFPTVGGNKKKANTLEGNRYYGVENRTSTLTLDATYNWWADASGPYPVGNGDAASAYVNYADWLTYPMAWVQIDDVWTVDPVDESFKDHFLPGDSIGYRIRYSMRNGTETQKTRVTAKGLAKIEKTDLTIQKHVSKGRTKNISGFCYEDLFWDRTISADALAGQKVKASMKLKVKGLTDKKTTRFWID